jgi:hypothetical protein
MRHLLLALKLLVFLYLGYLTVYFMTGYDPTSASYRPPFVLWVLDILNLYIHEAGHFLFQVFGRWVYFLGGSLMQVLLPLALLIVSWRQNITHIGYAGFWLGENFINVSVYIKDAPYRHLRLIGQGLIHDWNWLLSGNLGAAEPLGDIVFYAGVLLCSASIVTGVYFAILSFREEAVTNL